MAANIVFCLFEFPKQKQKDLPGNDARAIMNFTGVA